MTDTPTTPDATLSSHAETGELVDDATFTKNVAMRIETLTNALRQVPPGPEGRWLRVTFLDVLGLVHAVSNRLGMLAARIDDAKFAGAQIDCPASAEEIAEARRVLALPSEPAKADPKDERTYVTIAPIEGAKTPPFVKFVRCQPPAERPADPYNPINHDRVLWAVYGATCQPSMICCKLFAYDHNHKQLPAGMAPVLSDGQHVAVWGYSVWKGVPGFRTLGKDIRSFATGPDGVLEFYVSQDAALARLRELTTPADSAPCTTGPADITPTPAYALPPGSEPFDPIAANAIDSLNTLLRATSPSLEVSQAFGKLADALLTLGRRRDTERCRAATQAIVEEIGASGPMSLEEAVAKVLERLRKSEAPRATYPGVHRIECERLRQINKLGYTFDHDDEHADGELAMAAACYAAPTLIFTRNDHRNGAVWFNDPWPWQREEDARWEDGGVVLRLITTEDRIHLLTKAGALIAAEIDRLLRKSSAKD